MYVTSETWSLEVARRGLSDWQTLEKSQLTLSLIRNCLVKPESLSTKTRAKRSCPTPRSSSQWCSLHARTVSSAAPTFWFQLRLRMGQPTWLTLLQTSRFPSWICPRTIWISRKLRWILARLSSFELKTQRKSPANGGSTTHRLGRVRTLQIKRRRPSSSKFSHFRAPCFLDNVRQSMWCSHPTLTRRSHKSLPSSAKKTPNSSSWMWKAKASTTLSSSSQQKSNLDLFSLTTQNPLSASKL